MSSQAPVLLSAGEQPIPGYVVEGVLGQGGFGAVYKARAPSGRQVALKIAFRGIHELPTREMVWLQTEVEILLRLQHPSIVQVLDHGWLPDGRLFVSMELVEGETLYDWIYRVRGLDPLQALGVAMRIAEGLVHSHALGVLHLDLKPANVIVTNPHEPRVKILDFGLSKLTHAWSSVTETTPGTPEFMPPEVFERGDVVPDTSFDLYGLGSTIYEMLAARMPFVPENPKHLAELKRGGVYPPLRSVAPRASEELAMLVAMLMAHDRTGRPADAAQVLEVLREQYYATLGDPPSVNVPAVPPIPRPPMEAGARGEAPFVGRIRELEYLRRSWAGTLFSERGSVLAVTGAAGVGKSRLVAAFLDELDRQGAVTAYGRSREIAGQIPYAALREALGRIARRLKTMPPDQRTRCVQRMAALRGDVSVLAALVPEATKYLAYIEQPLPTTRVNSTAAVARAVLDTLYAVSPESPVALVIENLQWADAATRAVVDILLVSALPARSMLLLTMRQADGVLADGVPRLLVGPLDVADNDLHLSALLGAPQPHILAALKACVPLLASGNPFFNVQVLRDMEVEGCIERAPDGAIGLSPKLSSYTPPDSVHDVIARAIHRLPMRAATILGVGALIGRRFRREDLWAVELFPRQQVDHALDEALALGLCQPSRDGSIAFTHPVVRAFTARAIDPDLELEVHGRIAQALQARDASAAEIAPHLEASGAYGRAARQWLDAGIDAERSFDPMGARDKLRRAHGLLIGLPPSRDRDEDLVRTTFERARIASMLEDTADIVDELTRTRMLLGRNAHPSENPELALGLASAEAILAYARGDFDSVLEVCQRALSLPVGDSDVAQRYQVAPTNILGRALCATGRHAAALPLLERGCKLARASASWGELAHSRGMMAMSLGSMGNLREARATVDRAATLADRMGDPVRKVAALVYRAMVADLTFDWSEGVRASTDALRYAEEESIGGMYTYLATLSAGRHQFHSGELERAQVLLESALEQGESQNTRMARSWAHAFLGDVHFAAGRIDAATDAYRSGLEISNRHSDEFGQTLNRGGLGHAGALTGKEPGWVRRLFTDAIEQSRRAPNLRLLVDTFERLAESLEHLHDPEAAGRARAERAAIFERMGVPPVSWWPPGTARHRVARPTTAPPWPSTGIPESAQRGQGVAEPRTAHANVHHVVSEVTWVTDSVDGPTQPPRTLASVDQLEADSGDEPAP